MNLIPLLIFHWQNSNFPPKSELRQLLWLQSVFTVISRLKNNSCYVFETVKERKYTKCTDWNKERNRQRKTITTELSSLVRVFRNVQIADVLCISKWNAYILSEIHAFRVEMCTFHVFKVEMCAFYWNQLLSFSLIIK